jgi:hypothetical protein
VLLKEEIAMGLENIIVREEIIKSSVLVCHQIEPIEILIQRAKQLVSCLEGSTFLQVFSRDERSVYIMYDLENFLLVFHITLSVNDVINFLDQAVNHRIQLLFCDTGKVVFEQHLFFRRSFSQGHRLISTYIPLL